MAIQVRKFNVGKDAAIDRINRFFQERGLKPANIVDIGVVDRGRDANEYFVTFEDITAPFLVTTLPADGDTNVGVGTPVIAIFSEAIQNVTTSDIEIVNVTDSITIAPSLFSIDNTGASNDKGEIRIVDEGYMEANKVFRITFKTSITDLAGNALAEQESILIGTVVVSADLEFDGGRISSFTKSDGIHSAIVTPTRLSFGEDTLLHLTLRAPDTTEFFHGLNIHYEALVSPSGSFRAIIENTGVLPTGTALDWRALNGLLS